MKQKKRYLSFLLILSMVMQYVPATPAEAKASDYEIQYVMLQLSGDADNPDSFTIDLPTDGKIMFHCSQKIKWKLDEDEVSHLAGRFENRWQGGSWTTGRGEDPGFRDGKFYDPDGCYYGYKRGKWDWKYVSSSTAENDSDYWGSYYYSQWAIIGDYWGSISAGRHTFTVADYNGCSGDCVLAYVFYPTCPIYWLDGEDWKQLQSYVRYEEDMYDDETPTWYVPSEITLNNPPARHGYTFEGWYEDKNLTQRIEKIDTSTGKEWYLYPNYTPDSYTITYDPMGGTNVEGNPESYTIENGTLRLLPAVRKGYTFVRWYERSGVDKVTVSEIDATRCEDIELYAEWSKDTYTITYQDGFTHSNPATYQVTDSPITLTAATRPGCEFDRWYADAAHTEKITQLDCGELAKNITIYAGWNPISYPVTYELDGGTNAEANPAAYTVVEDPITLQPPTKKGYTFMGWYKMEGEEKVDVTQIDTSACAPLTLYAEWSKNTNLTFVNGYDHENQDSFPVTYGTYRLKDASRNGYNFTGWYRDQECTQKVTEIDCSTAEDITLYAGWELLTYNITYVLNGGTNDAANLTSYSAEAAFELKAPVKKGYDFIGWFEDAEYTKQVEDAGITVFRDMTLSAKWQEHDYQITYENAYTHSNPVTYRMMSSPLALQDAERDGYRFAGWYADEACEQQVTSLDRTRAEDVTLYAKWELVQYTVTWHLEGGTNAQTNVETYSAEAPSTLADPAKKGYDFKGWYLDEAYQKAVTRIGETVFGNLDIYARWTPHAYRLSYEDCGTHSNPATYTVEDIELPLGNAEKTGYRFMGWYLDAAFQTKVETLDCTQAKDVTLYAKWENVEYPVTYVLNGGTNAVDNITHFTVETSFELKQPVKTGYDFKGWYKDEALTQEVEKINSSLLGELSLYAKWELHTYTITYMDGEDKTTATYTVEDEKTALSVPEKKGQDFVGWYTEKECQTKVDALNLKAPGDLTLYAKWKNTVYSVQYELDGGENDSRNIKEYTIDTAFPLKAAAKTGYDFGGWYLDKELQKEVEEINSALLGDVTLYAKWTPHTYTITYVDEKDKTTAKYTVEDQKVALAVPKRDGKDFQGWYTDTGYGTKVESVDLKTPEDLTLYAKWTDSAYPIEYELDGGKNDSSNITKYTSATAFQLKAPSKTGYDFAGWFTDLEEEEAVTEIKGQFSGELTLYAKWTPHTYTITYVDGNEHSNAKSYTVLDQKITLQDAKKTGYQFAGWYADATFEQPVKTVDCTKACDVSLYAKWGNEIYNIRYELDGGENDSDNIPQYAVNTEFEFKAPEKEGYDFKGWFTDSEKKDEIKDTKGHTGDLTLYAAWEPHQYKITVVNGFIHSIPESYTVEQKTVLLEDADREEYLFDGWYLDKELTQKIEKLLPQTEGGKDITIYGRWTSAKYKVTRKSIEMAAGDSLEIKCPSDGYLELRSEYPAGGTAEFKWNDVKLEDSTNLFSGEVTGGTYTLTAEGMTGGNAVISYVYRPTCTVYYQKDGKWNPLFTYRLKDTSTPHLLPENYGEINGYMVSEWYLDETMKTRTTEIDESKGTDWYVYPKLVPNEYRIQYEVSGGTHDNPERYTIEDGILKLKSAEKDGFTFKRWYQLDGAEKVTVTEIDCSKCQDYKLYAEWETAAYKITYVDGYTHANPQSYTILDPDITLLTATRNGFVFLGWYEDKDLEVPVTVIHTGKAEDLTLYAAWQPETYTVQYVLNGGVNAEGNEDSFTADTIFTVEAPQRDNYDFAGWFVDELCQTEFVALDEPVCRSVTLYAKWEPHAYEITYELNGGINASNNPEDHTIEDESIILEEPERSGYIFLGWYILNGETKMYLTEIDPSIQEDITLYAEWKVEETVKPASATTDQTVKPVPATTEQKQPVVNPTTEKQAAPSKTVTEQADDEDEDWGEEEDEDEIPTVSKVKSVKAAAKKNALRITWKNQSGVAGYQLQTSLKKSFKSAKTITVKKNAKAYTVKKLKAKKKYYVRIRAYKTYKASSGKTKTVYGKWTVINKKTK